MTEVIDEVATPEVIEEEEKPVVKKEPPKEVSKKKLKVIEERLDQVDMAAVQAEKQKLEAIEARIDKKIGRYKKLVEEAEFHGKSVAGAFTEEDEDTKQKKAANDLVRSTGMLPYPEVENAPIRPSKRYQTDARSVAE